MRKKQWWRKFLKISLVFILTTSWLFSGWPQIWENPKIPPKIRETYASNYLSNPSFTGGTTDWTLSITTYDASYFQDTPGSVKTQTSVGRNNSTTGYAQQTIGTNIEAGSTIKLGHYWSKQCVAIVCTRNTISVDILKPSDPYTWVTIWSDATTPSSGSATAWTGPSNLDVSSYFNETGTYIFRVYADLRSGNNSSAQSLAWFDNVNLDVTLPNITVGTTGTQTPNMNVNSANNYVGGAFTFIRNSGTANITQIIITDTGTVNANSNLSNIDLYYETAGSCSYEGTETLFGTAASFNASEKATVTGIIPVGTSQVCLYVVLDVSSGASADQTVEIEISNSSTEVTVSSGTVSPATIIAIADTTTLQAAGIVSVTITTDGTVAYGIVPSSTSKSTIDLTDTQTAKNDGNVTETFNIKTSNASGGTSWSLGSTPGTNVFVHEFSTNGGSNWTKFNTVDEYQQLATGIIADGTQNFDLRITVPSESSDYQEKTITITIQAVEE